MSYHGFLWFFFVCVCVFRGDENERHEKRDQWFSQTSQQSCEWRPNNWCLIILYWILRTWSRSMTLSKKLQRFYYFWWSTSAVYLANLQNILAVLQDVIFSSLSMSTLVSLVRNRFYTSMKSKCQSAYELASECCLTSVGFINRCSLTLHESQRVRLVLSTAIVSTELSTSLITFYPIPFTPFWNLFLDFSFQSESFVMQCRNNDAQYAITHRTLVT